MSEFKGFLAEIGHTQSSFARLMVALGDDRKPGTVLRAIQGAAGGQHRLSGEMRIIMALLRRHPEEAAVDPDPA